MKAGQYTFPNVNDNLTFKEDIQSMLGAPMPISNSQLRFLDSRKDMFKPHQES